MAKGRSTLAVALLFVWMAAPALRCLVPGEVLTPEERACCQAMAGQCSESGATDHPCCKKATPTAQPALASAQATAPAISPIVASMSMLSQQQIEQTFAADWLLDPSPPVRFEQSSPILRI